MAQNRSGLSSPDADPAPTATPRRPSRGFNVAVHRQGCVVNLSLTAGDEYGAVELYEHFVRSLEKGRLSLDIR